MSPPIHFYTALSRSIVNIRSPAFSLCRPATRSEHNWSKPVRKPKPWIKPLPLPPGCDFKHWLVVMENPVHEKTRPEMIEYFVKTLAQVVGSEEAAKEKIYSISHKHYIAFGVRLSESFTHNLKELPDVRWVLPDSYMSGSKNYGGEPFVKGQALPYEKSFHKAWLDRKAWVQKMQDMEYEEEHQKCWEYKLEMEKEKKKNKKKGRPRANIGGMDQKGMRGPPHGGGMQHHLNNGEAATYGEDGDNESCIKENPYAFSKDTLEEEEEEEDDDDDVRIQDEVQDEEIPKREYRIIPPSWSLESKGTKQVAAHGEESDNEEARKALECHCIAHLRDGPCGNQFSNAFLCFLKSTAEEKGSDCVSPFVAFQSCVMANPDAFSKDVLEDDDDVKKQEVQKEETPKQEYRILSIPFYAHVNLL